MSNQGQAAQNIIVIRLGELADLMFTLPLLRSLRAQRPKAHVTVVGFAWAQTVIELAPDKLVDDYIFVDEERLPNGELDVRAVMTEEVKAQLQQQTYDEAWQCSAPLDQKCARQVMNVVKARRKKGFAGQADQVAQLLLPKPYYLHEITAHLQLLGDTDAQPFYLQAGANTSRLQQPRSLKRFVTARALKTAVVLHSGAGDLRRTWPAEGFAELANRIGRDDRPIILTGTLSEVAYSAKVQSLTKAQTIDLTGKLGLSELLYVLAKARLLVANDTGPLHAARALGTPTVGLFSARYFSHVAPLFANHDLSIISSLVVCPLCGEDVANEAWPALAIEGSRRAAVSCQHTVSLLQDISVEQVVSAANQLLKQA